MPSPRVAELVGRVFGGRYRLTRPIGTGASAQVYAAEDVTLRRRVAVKVLHPALSGDQSFGPRFKAEARAVASLRHPNIATVFDWGEEDGWSYLVMELLEGGSLRAMLDRGHLLSPAQAAAAGADSARALAHAHRRGLVHRDIKPANLIFDDEGRVRVADFGLARALAEATWTEPMGAVVGTARYCSPEQARGEPLDGRADVYSLALVLIEATTGKVPFTTDTTMGTIMARLETPIPVAPGLGPLGAALEGAGALEPARRLDASELADALDEAVRLLPTPAPLPLAHASEESAPVEDADPTRLSGGPILFDADSVREYKAVSGHAPPHGVDEAAAQDSLAEDRPGRRLRRERPARPPRPRRTRRSAALAAALVVVLLGGGAAAYVLTRPPPKHPVPQLAGKTEAQATAALHHVHFHLAVTGRSYSPSVEAGSVIGQSPTTGKLREGSTVKVTLSEGPQPVRVPMLTNSSQAAATNTLASLGLKVTVTMASSLTVGAGYVISSMPDSGTLLPGQVVNLVVSSGLPQVTVPLLSGSELTSFAAAQQALAAANLQAVESDQYSNNVTAGLVIITNPAPGASVQYGSTVTVEISLGPPKVAIPDVRGTSVSAATAALQAAGLVVTGVTGNPSRQVTGTSPPVGTSVLIGSNVQLLTG